MELLNDSPVKSQQQKRLLVILAGIVAAIICVVTLLSEAHITHSGVAELNKIETLRLPVSLREIIPHGISRILY